MLLCCCTLLHIFFAYKRRKRRTINERALKKMQVIFYQMRRRRKKREKNKWRKKVDNIDADIWQRYKSKHFSKSAKMFLLHTEMLLIQFWKIQSTKTDERYFVQNIYTVFVRYQTKHISFFYLFFFYIGHSCFEHASTQYTHSHYFVPYNTSETHGVLVFCNPFDSFIFALFSWLFNFLLYVIVNVNAITFTLALFHLFILYLVHFSLFHYIESFTQRTYIKRMEILSTATCTPTPTHTMNIRS